MKTFQKFLSRESGNAAMIALVVIAVLAVGGLTYYSTQIKGSDSDEVATASADQSPAAGTPADDSDFEIKPGNPVVAKINGQEIKRLDVFAFIQNLPAETRQIPTEQLFPAALEQVINARVINDKTEDVQLDNDPDVKAQLAEAKKNIVRNIYVQKQVEKRMTDERVQQAYEQYRQNFPEIQEVKARHILVKDEATAKDVIKQLNDGADFAALAKEFSTDGTAEKGGEVGYFAQSEVVAEFGQAAFDQDVGEISDQPVKTEFGYHVIQVEEKRQRPAAEFDQVKPFLEAQLRRIILDEVIQSWRANAEIQRFDINGEPVKKEPANQG